MPLVQISLVEGYPMEAKAELLRAVTEAVVRTTGAPADRVRVLLYELPAGHWAVGGVAKDAEG